MRWRSVAGDTHPLAIPLLGAVSACAFGSLYWLVGVGGTPLHGALTFAIFYGSIVALSAELSGVRSNCSPYVGARQNSSVSNPQNITPPRSFDHSDGFRANSLPSLITYSSIADTRC